MHPAFSTATSFAAFSFSCRLNHRLLYPSSSYERRATPVHPRPSLRASPRRAAPKKARLAKGRPASWRSLADQYPPPRTRTDGHACARCGPLSFSFFPLFRFGTALPPFSARLRRSPHPSLLSICPFPRLSTTFPFSSSPRPLPLPFPSPPLPSLRAVTLVFPDSPSSSVLLSPGASPFSCYLFVFCALSIFLPLLSPAPPIFPLPYAYCPCSVRLPPSASLFFNPFLPPRCSIFLPSVPLYIPRRLRRDGPIFSSRFLGSDIFYTFFSPLPPLRRLPMRRSPPPSEYRLEHSLHLPLCRVAHTHMVSLPLVPSILRPFPPLIRPPLFHFSLPFPPASVSLSLSLFCPPPSSPAFHPCGSYLFDFFFTATRPPTDAERRRPFSIGTLFSTIGSTTYSRTHVRTLVACARGRDGEIKKGVKRELVDVGGKGGPGDVREERG